MNALNKQTIIALTNNSGSPATQGSVVIIDSAANSAFITTATAGLATKIIGVVVEPNGIASLAKGMVAIAGYVDKMLLVNSACPGYSVGTSASPFYGTSHSDARTGDFAQTLASGTTPVSLLGGIPVQASSQPYAIIRQQEVSTTLSGSSIVGVQTRILNTIVSDISGIVVSLAANQFTLLPGKYRIHVDSPCMGSDRTQVSLYDTSASAYLCYGTSLYYPAGAVISLSANLDSEFTAVAGHALEIRQQIQTARSYDGLGCSNNFGTIEVFTTVEVWKVA